MQNDSSIQIDVLNEKSYLDLIKNMIDKLDDKRIKHEDLIIAITGRESIKSKKSEEKKILRNFHQELKKILEKQIDHEITPSDIKLKSILKQSLQRLTANPKATGGYNNNLKPLTQKKDYSFFSNASHKKKSKVKAAVILTSADVQAIHKKYKKSSAAEFRNDIIKKYDNKEKNNIESNFSISMAREILKLFKENNRGKVQEKDIKKVIKKRDTSASIDAGKLLENISKVKSKKKKRKIIKI